jgi:hypothetical protein
MAFAGGVVKGYFLRLSRAGSEILPMKGARGDGDVVP